MTRVEGGINLSRADDHRSDQYTDGSNHPVDFNQRHLCPPPNPPLDPREYELPDDDEQFS